MNKKDIIKTMVNSTLESRHEARRTLEQHRKFRSLPKELKLLFYDTYQYADDCAYKLLSELINSVGDYQVGDTYEEWVDSDDEFFDLCEVIREIYDIKIDNLFI